MSAHVGKALNHNCKGCDLQTRVDPIHRLLICPSYLDTRTGIEQYLADGDYNSWAILYQKQTGEGQCYRLADMIKDLIEFPMTTGASRRVAIRQELLDDRARADGPGRP